MALLVLASLVGTAAAVEVTCLTTQTEIDFVSATLMYNNLGGMGPNFDEPAMLRYAGVGTKDGDRVDLTVTAVTAYVPTNTASNGLNGAFGQINMNVNQAATFEFAFVNADAGDAAMSVDPFYFSFFDLDGSKKVTEYWCWDDEPGRLELSYEDSADISAYAQATSCEGGAGSSTVFVGEEMGFGCDNPMDPTNLYKIDCDTVESDDACYSECQNSNKARYFPIDQAQRSVTATYLDGRESFRFTASAYLDANPTAQMTSGRNLVFAGTSSIIETECCTMAVADGDPSTSGGACGGDVDGVGYEPISFAAAGALCCDGAGGAVAVCGSPCELVAFWDADDRCADLGLRLCSAGEVLGGLAYDDAACGFSSAPVWTSDAGTCAGPTGRPTVAPSPVPSLPPSSAPAPAPTAPPSPAPSPPPSPAPTTAAPTAAPTTYWPPDCLELISWWSCGVRIANGSLTKARARAPSTASKRAFQCATCSATRSSL